MIYYEHLIFEIVTKHSSVNTCITTNIHAKDSFINNCSVFLVKDVVILRVIFDYLRQCINKYSEYLHIDS